MICPGSKPFYITNQRETDVLLTSLWQSKNDVMFLISPMYLKSGHYLM